MSIPKKLKVGPHTLTIEQLGPDVMDGAACVHLPTGKITIRSDASETVKWDGIIHEVLEFIQSLGNLKLSHDDLTQIGVWMYQFIVDNIKELNNAAKTAKGHK